MKFCWAEFFPGVMGSQDRSGAFGGRFRGFLRLRDPLRVPLPFPLKAPLRVFEGSFKGSLQGLGFSGANTSNDSWILTVTMESADKRKLETHVSKDEKETNASRKVQGEKNSYSKLQKVGTSVS